MNKPPKEQAEEMARGIFRDSLRIFDSENINEEDAIMKAASITLQKLIEKSDSLQSQLTAANEKIEKLKQGEKWMRHGFECKGKDKYCTCGLTDYRESIKEDRCECGGNIVSKGIIGTDHNNQEQEADWEECEKCGKQIDL